MPQNIQAVLFCIWVFCMCYYILNSRNYSSFKKIQWVGKHNFLRPQDMPSKNVHCRCITSRLPCCHLIYRRYWKSFTITETFVATCLFVCTTVYPKKYAHGFVVLCFVVVMQSFIMNSHEVFFHIHQGCFAGTGAIVRLPQCRWSKPDGYGKISQCITTTKHRKAKTVCIFLGIYCMSATGCLTSLGGFRFLYHSKCCHRRWKHS